MRLRHLRSAYRFPDGSVFEPYYSYSRRDYVVIVASDEDGNYLCVRQFRQGITAAEYFLTLRNSVSSRLCSRALRQPAAEKIWA